MITFRREELIGADKSSAAVFAAERMRRPTIDIPARGWRREKHGALYEGRWR
jgi:hypothetical protein